MQFTSFPRKIHSGDTRDAMRDVRDFDQELRKLIKSGGSGNRRYQETIEERDRVVRYASAWRNDPKFGDRSLKLEFPERP